MRDFQTKILKKISHPYSQKVKTPPSIHLSSSSFILGNFFHLCQTHPIRSRSWAERFFFFIFFQPYGLFQNSPTDSSKALEEKLNPLPAIFRLLQACENVLHKSGCSVCFQWKVLLCLGGTGGAILFYGGGYERKQSGVSSDFTLKVTVALQLCFWDVFMDLYVCCW